MDVSRFLEEELKAIDLLIEKSQDSFVQKEYDSIDLLKLLRHSGCERTVFYESKDSDFSFLGLGQAEDLKYPDIKNKLANKELKTPLFVQGTFEGSVDKYQGTFFEWTFVNQNKKTILTIQSKKKSADVFNQDVWESFIAPWNDFEETPEHDEWSTWIDSAHQLFESKTLDKIVLSRKKIFNYADPIDTLLLFSELYRANSNSSHFTLYNQINPQNVFISFTPEKLFTLKGKTIDTLALAGSMPRGENADQDLVHYEELKSSQRLTHEHSTVTNDIKALLETVCDEVNVSDLKIMKLPYIFHRQQDFTGTIKSTVDSLDLVKLLHPTPAVGGFPRASVGQLILNIEKEKREKYAAPFGIISNEFSEFAVGIRSAIIEDTKMTVFGGAGIVAGSNAEDEWNETGTKMKPFLKVINQTL